MEKFRTVFRYPAHYHTRKVEVVGDFNNWKPSSFPLSDEDGDNTWEGFLDLPAGRYEYLFLVDGEYRTDPMNTFTVQGPHGLNSVLLTGEFACTGDALHTGADIDFVSSCKVVVKAAVQSKKFTSARLILVFHDKPQSVPGYEVFRDAQYGYYFFPYENNRCIDEILYYFELTAADGRHVFFGANGVVEGEWEVESFERVLKDTHLDTPAWVQDAVFYQIFPDRFCNGNPALNPPAVASPDAMPTAQTFYGGDLPGIISRLDYLKTLGVNALYFNPLFEAPSIHKYDTTDYLKIDPHFGTLEDFRTLVKEAHARGMKVLLDGVFNHTGRGFKAFQDIEKKGEKSKYLDWYTIHGFPLIVDGKPNYECWWGFADLPKLNTANPEVRQYLMDVATFWIKEGADGWRLDVPNEIPHEFWKEFRREVRAINPRAYIVGEIWQSGAPWLQGDEFDSVMNYRFREACVDFFALRKLDALTFSAEIGRIMMEYPRMSIYSGLNLLSSHDTARFYTVAGKNMAKVRLAVAFLLTMPGAPSIYYGEEIGMEGQKDPDNRRAMIWDENRWNGELMKCYQDLIRLRHEHEVLRRGEFRFLMAKDGTIGFERFDTQEKLAVFINNSDQCAHIDVTEIFGNGDFTDISRDHPLKRKKAYSLYGNDYVILKKVKER